MYKCKYCGRIDNKKNLRWHVCINPSQGYFDDADLIDTVTLITPDDISGYRGDNTDNTANTTGARKPEEEALWKHTLNT